MNKWTIFLLLLAGCQQEPGPPQTAPIENPAQSSEAPTLPAFPFAFDIETPGGILIQTNGHTIPPAEDIDRWYNEVQQCIANWYPILYPDKTFEFAEPPPVVLVEDTRTLCGTGATGMYCRNYLISFVGLNNSWAKFPFKWKHEFEHHILTANGFDDAMQLNHRPPQFWGIGGCEYQ